MNDLAAAFRELRTAWFDSQLRSHSHERGWENEEAEALRVAGNNELQLRYDQQTEAIIEGLAAPVCPMCAMDLEVNGLT